MHQWKGIESPETSPHTCENLLLNINKGRFFFLIYVIVLKELIIHVEISESLNVKSEMLILLEENGD